VCFLDKVVVSSHGGNVGSAALGLFAGGEAGGLLGALPNDRFLGVGWLSGSELLHGAGSGLGSGLGVGLLAGLATGDLGSGGS
jgi:hypothetical protein